MDSVFDAIPDHELPDEFVRDPEPLSERELERVGFALSGLITHVHGDMDEGFDLLRCRACKHVHTSYDPACPACGSGSRTTTELSGHAPD